MAYFNVEDEYDGDFYSVGYRDELLEDDEITPEESAFMAGYEDA